MNTTAVAPEKSRKKKRVLAIAGGASLAVLVAAAGGTLAQFSASQTSDNQVINSASASLVFSDTVDAQTFETKVSNIAAGDSIVQYFDLTNEGGDQLVNYTIAGDFDGSTTGVVRAASDPEMIDADGMTVTIVEVNADGSALAGAVPFTKVLDAGSFAPIAFSAGGPTDADETQHYSITTTLDTDEVAQDKSFVGAYTFAAVQNVDQD